MADARMDGTELERADFRIKALREALNDILSTDIGKSAAFVRLSAQNALRVDEGRAKFTEESCPGHVASAASPKICDRCGVHIDSLRPTPPGDTHG